jgi:DNA-binding NarL/FixJ family response regulator
LIIADDHHLLVEGLRAMLTPRFDVVAVAHSGGELLAILPIIQADCLLLDLALPGRNGLELLPDIRDLQPHLKVLVVTMHVDRMLADVVVRDGAHGFVPKDSDLAELEHAIMTVLEGRRYVSPRVPSSSRKLGLGAEHQALARLTPRQQAVVRLIGRGKSSAEIGRILGVSPATVALHRHNIRRTLGIETEWGLVRYAILIELIAQNGAGAPMPTR